ncbi:MAG TPA: hypothetical protein DCM05_02970 [Elusimicrobia bacterium]|nr:hypothetical protein [Elusimicrobiota bacterium]
MAALLRIAVLVLVSAQAWAECPAFDPSHERLWGFTQQAWTAACERSEDPAKALEQAKRAFIRDCEARHPALPKDKLSASCALGKPGEESLFPGGAEPFLKPAAPDSAFTGLDKLIQDGPDAARLDAAFTGAAARAAMPEEGSGAPKAFQTLRSGARTLAPAALVYRAAPPKEPPISRADLDRYVRLEVFAGQAARTLDRWTGGRLSDRLLPEEKRFAQDVLSHLQSSSEGRVILRSLIEESRKSGQPVSIRIVDYPGTQVIKYSGIEDLQGGVYGEAYTAEGVLHLNRAFMRYQDRDAAIEDAAGTAGHELNHIRLYRKVKRLLPEYADVFDNDLSDEIAARVKGALVSVELNRGRATSDTEGARGIAADAEGYFERMKLWSPGYSLSLDLAEMADPLQAYQGRLGALEEALQDAKDSLKEQPRLLRRIRHFETVHKLAGRLDELKGQVEANLKTLPSDIEQYEETLKLVRQQIAYLGSSEGRTMLEKLRKASQDPKYGKIMQEVRADLAKLKERTAARPLPKPKPDSRQIGWAEFHELVKKDLSHAKDLD